MEKPSPTDISRGTLLKPMILSWPRWGCVLTTPASCVWGLASSELYRLGLLGGGVSEAELQIKIVSRQQQCSTHLILFSWTCPSHTLQTAAAPRHTCTTTNSHPPTDVRTHTHAHTHSDRFREVLRFLTSPAPNLRRVLLVWSSKHTLEFYLHVGELDCALALVKMSLEEHHFDRVSPTRAWFI